MNRSTLSTIAIATVLVSGLLATVCRAETKSADTVASKTAAVKVVKTLTPQTTCPVMGGAINKELFVDKDGKRIYVCCGGCIDAVSKDFSTYEAKLAESGQAVEFIAAATPEPASNKQSAAVAAAKNLAPQTTCPVMGNPINKKLFVDKDGKRMYVCCGGCINPVKKDFVKYEKKLEEMGQGVEKSPKGR